MELVNGLQPFASLISSIISAAILFALYAQFKENQKQKVEIMEAAQKLLETELKLKTEKVQEFEKINKDLAKVGSFLGIPEFKDKSNGNVSIDVSGDNFQGDIAGRDLNKTIHDLSRLVDKSNRNIGELLDQSQNLFTSSDSNTEFEYEVDYIFLREHRKFKVAFSEMIQDYFDKGWQFVSISSDYQGIDGCILIFRKEK